MPLEDILRNDGPGSEDDALVEPSPGGSRNRRRLVLGSIIGSLGLLLLLAGYFLVESGKSVEIEITTERVLPRYAAPGNLIPVRVRLHVDGETRGFILRENFPPEWTVVEASPAASSLDPSEGTIRWIIKPGELQTTIAYIVRVASDAEIDNIGRFRGEVVAQPNGRSILFPVTGAQDVQVSPHIWADLDGDDIIDDGEMLQASETFDEMEGIHLDWKQLEAIWDAGRYRWEPETKKFHPVSRNQE